MHEKSPGLELQTGTSAEAAMMMMMKAYFKILHLRLQSTFRGIILFKMYFLGQNEVLRIIFHLKKNYLKRVNIDGKMTK